MNRAIQERTGYRALDIDVVRCKAKLPAALWRSLSAAERPYAYRDVAVVAVQDADEMVIAMPSRHYDALVDRVRQLEQWVGELLEEDGGEQA